MTPVPLLPPRWARDRLFPVTTYPGRPSPMRRGLWERARGTDVIRPLDRRRWPDVHVTQCDPFCQTLRDADVAVRISGQKGTVSTRLAMSLDRRPAIGTGTGCRGMDALSGSADPEGPQLMEGEVSDAVICRGMYDEALTRQGGRNGANEVAR